MIELDRMNGHDTAFPEVASPILVSVFVVYPVLNVVRKQIFELEWCPQLQVNLGEFARRGLGRDS